MRISLLTGAMGLVALVLMGAQSGCDQDELLHNKNNNG